MAKFGEEDGHPGSIGPDLGALDEDLLSADLEADLDGDIGDGELGESDLSDSGEDDDDGDSEDLEDGDRDGDEVVGLGRCLGGDDGAADGNPRQCE